VVYDDRAEPMTVSVMVDGRRCGCERRVRVGPRRGAERAPRGAYDGRTQRAGSMHGCHAGRNDLGATNMTVSAKR
jgi:hypothetical protein